MPGTLAWQCPICLDTLEQPVLATCCGQSFCKDCLDGALAVADACPMCREPLLSGRHSMTRNRVLEEILTRLTPRETGSSDSVLITIDPEDEEEFRGVQKSVETGDTSLLKSICSVLEASRSHLRRCRVRCVRDIRAQQWWHWCRIHWGTLQCLFYVALFFLLVFFLRVQEETYASQPAHR